MKNKLFLIIFLFLLNCNPFYEEKEKPFLVVVNTLSENLVYLKNKDSNEFKDGPKLGLSPNHIIYNNGYFFVINSLSNSVMKFDSFLNLVNEFSVLPCSNPYKGVVINDKIYITSYLLHSVMIYNHNTGKNLKNISLNPVEYNSKIYYPFPCGIVYYNNYLFVTCKDTPDTTAKNALKGRVAVIDITNNRVIGYIQSEGYNTTNLLIYNDFLYIISTGTYDSGYKEDGIIERIDLKSFDFDSFSYNRTIVASGNSFGTLCFTLDYIFTGNIGNSKLIKFDKEWKLIDYQIIKSDGFSFVSDLKFYNNKLFLLEYNSATFYIINPFNFNIEKGIKTSLNKYGDPINFCILD